MSDDDKLKAVIKFNQDAERFQEGVSGWAMLIGAIVILFVAVVLGVLR